MLPVLGYWKTRTLAQHIRLLLVYTDTAFKNKYHHVGPEPDYDKSDWYSVKYKMGLDFPNLPYYIDDNIKLTQSTAILRYIGRKNNMCGRTEEERVRLDILLSQTMDFAEDFWKVFYYNLERKDVYLLKELPVKLWDFSNFLGDRKWFVSNQDITVADFFIYELLDHHVFIEPTILDNYKNIQRFMQRFRELPRIKEYLASPDCLRGPVFNIYSQYEVEQRK
ncbi:hypothetical protein Pcinc_008639 [Petrolisthes cinctipes]|uniref:glutathione transferase n=1 Tax=Petrolisthes cinctipes TaxID=88211 RepID=A0AAE1KX23_PETCI|nr:hypothetical protein Pcinc_008639 [Petrolisthes cinctipes]